MFRPKLLGEFQRISERNILVTGFDNSPISREFGFTSLDQSLKDVANSALTILMGEVGNQIRKVDFASEEMDAHILLVQTSNSIVSVG